VLLRPIVLRELSGLIPLAAGLAVAEALEELAVPAQLKWPNDVLVAGRKISGVLCESTLGPAGLETVVVGIGVNVAALTDELPAELRGRATSLRAEGGSGDAVEVAAAVLARLPVWYHAVPAGSTVRQAWRERSVAWWGELVEVQAGEVVLRGRPHDLADDGGLLLQLEDGRLTKVLSGEVQELRRNASGGHGLTPA
jgi:BirA family biotin operon repressor/biotin-[acetyl-CoA-carboxylase] ligase